jgi:hypothetical protein
LEELSEILLGNPFPCGILRLLLLILIILSIFLSFLRLLIFGTIFPLVFSHLNLVSLGEGACIDLDFGFLFGFPVGVKVRRVVLWVLVKSNNEVVGVQSLVELRRSIDTRIHLVLSVVYQRLDLLLSITLAIELILKESLHLEVRVRASASITRITIVCLTVLSTDTVLMS